MHTLAKNSQHPFWWNMLYHHRMHKPWTLPRKGKWHWVFPRVCQCCSFSLSESGFGFFRLSFSVSGSLKVKCIRFDERCRSTHSHSTKQVELICTPMCDRPNGLSYILVSLAIYWESDSHSVLFHKINHPLINLLYTAHTQWQYKIDLKLALWWLCLRCQYADANQASYAMHCQHTLPTSAWTGRLRKIYHTWMGKCILRCIFLEVMVLIYHSAFEEATTMRRGRTKEIGSSSAANRYPCHRQFFFSFRNAIEKVTEFQRLQNVGIVNRFWTWVCSWSQRSAIDEVLNCCDW